MQLLSQDHIFVKKKKKKKKRKKSKSAKKKKTEKEQISLHPQNLAYKCPWNFFSEKLPDLKNSDLAIDKSKPLPTSLQSDFLPEDVLFALTQPPQIKEPLGPASRFRNLNTSVVCISYHCMHSAPDNLNFEDNYEIH